MALQITPFSTDNANLQGTSYYVGNYVAWMTTVEPGCVSGYRYMYQTYTGGTYSSGCATSNGDRSSAIYYQCGPAGTVASLAFIQESPACNVSPRAVQFVAPRQNPARIAETELLVPRSNARPLQYEFVLTLDCSSNTAAPGTLCLPVVSALSRVRVAGCANVERFARVC
jgi:hypothetical protein